MTRSVTTYLFPLLDGYCFPAYSFPLVSVVSWEVRWKVDMAVPLRSRLFLWQWRSLSGRLATEVETPVGVGGYSSTWVGHCVSSHVLPSRCLPKCRQWMWGEITYPCNQGLQKKRVGVA